VGGTTRSGQDLIKKKGGVLNPLVTKKPIREVRKGSKQENKGTNTTKKKRGRGARNHRFTIAWNWSPRKTRIEEKENLK